MLKVAVSVLVSVTVGGVPVMLKVGVSVTVTV